MRRTLGPVQKVTSKQASPPVRGAALSIRRLLRGAPKFRLEGRGTYRTKLHVTGSFRSGWLGSFASGLAVHGISVLEGTAECDPLGGWTAAIVLERSPTGSFPNELDFVDLADRDAHDFDGPRPELTVTGVTRVPDHGGCLRVVVEGKDQLGFLASVLTRLERVALFPVEMQIGTLGGRVHDELWLRSSGNRTPDAAAETAVRVALRSSPERPR